VFLVSKCVSEYVCLVRILLLQVFSYWTCQRGWRYVHFYCKKKSEKIRKIFLYINLNNYVFWSSNSFQFVKSEIDELHCLLVALSRNYARINLWNICHEHICKICTVGSSDFKELDFRFIKKHFSSFWSIKWACGSKVSKCKKRNPKQNILEKTKW